MSEPTPPFSPNTLAHWAARLRELRVMSNRLSSPDVVSQLQAGRRLDTIVCVGIDADPRVTLQQRTVVESAPEVAYACRALSKLLGDVPALVVVDRTHAGQFARLAGRLDRRLRVAGVDNLYPLAHPSLLAKVLRGRRLRPGRPPADAGVLLLDAVAAAEIGAALSDGRPAEMLPVVVCDHEHGQSKLLRVPADFTVAGVLAAAEIAPHTVDLVDGPLLRRHTVKPDTLVRYTELVLHVLQPTPAFSPEPCTRCGRCVVACPVRLQPAALLQASQDDDHAAANYFGIDACLACGLCDAVCPSALPITSAIVRLRTALENSATAAR